MRPAVQRAADLLWPPRCPFCGEVLGPVCQCPACAPAVRALELTPHRLQPGEHRLDGLSGAAAVYRYEGAAREAILKLKNGQPYLARWLGAQMACRLYGCTFEEGYGKIKPSPPALAPCDVIVAVPPSRRDRGYQAPALLARPLGRALGVPLAAGALRKARPTQPQAGLGAAERLANLTGSVVGAQPGQVAGRRVLLVDDVITTGATVSVCAAALLKAGAAEVFAVSVAAALPFGQPLEQKE